MRSAKAIVPLPTLVLVCKRPALGVGKQRLAARLGPERALLLAERLLDCALEDLAAWPGPQVIAPDAPQHADWAAQRAPFACCRPQPAGNLGQRLQALDTRLRDEGHQALLYIGSDAPTLTLKACQDAAGALQHADCLLLPARDGGVVLMASRRPWPELAALPWSSAQLGSALARACRAAGYRVAIGAAGADVDRPADLPPLARALAGDPRPARRRLHQTLESLLAEAPCATPWP